MKITVDKMLTYYRSLGEWELIDFLTDAKDQTMRTLLKSIILSKHVLKTPENSRAGR